MGALNEQLARSAGSCREVEEVASVWREALGGDDVDNGGDYENAAAEASPTATATTAKTDGSGD